MKFTINTSILKQYNFTLQEFLVLLIGYFELGYSEEYESLIQRGLIEKNLFHNLPPILSDNTKNLVAKILIESDEKAISSGINFDSLAKSLMNCYPTGIKPGTTYNWQGTVDEIAQRLRTLVVKYNFQFKEEEAIDAVTEYVNSFNDTKFMAILKNFILTVKKDSNGVPEINSMFMTIIENNRK